MKFCSKEEDVFDDEEEDISVQFIEAAITQKRGSNATSDVNTIDLLTRMSARRLDDQRCALPPRPLRRRSSLPGLGTPNQIFNSKSKLENERKSNNGSWRMKNFIGGFRGGGSVSLTEQTDRNSKDARQTHKSTVFTHATVEIPTLITVLHWVGFVMKPSFNHQTVHSTVVLCLKFDRRTRKNYAKIFPQ